MRRSRHSRAIRKRHVSRFGAGTVAMQNESAGVRPVGYSHGMVVRRHGHIRTEEGYVQVAVELPLSARAELADMELMESDARE